MVLSKGNRMTPLQMYNERAAECRREADAATLANVRNRCLDSASAWENMAHRAQQTETYRANEAQRKAALGNAQHPHRQIANVRVGSKADISAA